VLFEQLLGVSGVGPKVALAIVSGSPPADLRRAIALDDTARFEAIPASARRPRSGLCSNSRRKLGALEPVSIGTKPHLVARDALVELGYSVTDAEAALASVDPELPRRSACGSR